MSYFLLFPFPPRVHTWMGRRHGRVVEEEEEESGVGCRRAVVLRLGCGLGWSGRAGQDKT